MILEAIASVFILFFEFVLNLLPAVSSETLAGINSAYSGIQNAVEASAWILPSDTMFQILAFILIIEFSLLSFRLVRMLLGVISGGFLRT